MEPLQPMRPVSVQHDERDSPPRWKVWGVHLALASFVLTVVFVDERQSWSVAAGVCASVIGSALVVASTRRTIRENAGRRIPWLGRPPVEPRRMDLLLTYGMPMAAFGVALVARNGYFHWPVAVAVVCIGVVGLPAAAQAWHNYRVRTTSERSAR